MVEQKTANAGRKVASTRSLQQLLSNLVEGESDGVGELAVKMRADYQVTLAELTLRALIGSAKISIQVDGDERALALGESLERLFRDTMSKALDCIAYGRVAFEKEFAYSSGLNLYYVRRLNDLPFEATEMLLNQGQFAGIRLTVEEEKLDLDCSQSWWMALDPTPLQPHGKSRFLGAPHETWKRRHRLFHKREVFVDKHIISNGVARVPMDGEIQAGQEVDIATAMGQALDMLNSGGNVILSNERDADGNYAYDVSLSQGLNDPGPLETMIDGLDADQLRAFGIPEKTLIEGGQVGSYALVSLQMLVLYAVCEGILGQLERSYQRFVIDKSVAINQWAEAPEIKIAHSPMVNLEDPIIRDVVKQVLSGSGVPSALLASGAIDLQRLLEAVGIPLTENSSQAIDEFVAKAKSSAMSFVPAGGGGPPIAMSNAGPLDRLRSFPGAAKGSPTLSGVPSFNGLMDAISKELSEVYAAIAEELASLHKSHGHSDPIRLKGLLSRLRQLLVDSRTTGNLVGRVSLFSPRINSKPKGADVRQRPLKMSGDPGVSLRTVRSDKFGPVCGKYLSNKRVTPKSGGGGDGKKPRFAFVEDAVDYLLQKKLATSTELSQMAASDQTSVFSAPGVDDLPSLDALRGQVASSLLAGESLSEFRKSVDASLGLSRSTVETIFRTYTKQAYVEGMEATQTKPEIKSLFGYVVYTATSDNRVRESHWDLDGFVCSVDDPAYAVLKRALADWNCRCSLIPLTLEQASVRGIKTWDDLPLSVKAKYG